ncbi:hypothetical protein UFOVP71_3 [uncultured Caudovirales phage]|uniref:Uncharacterized protein n=1 Tax=uncultured Caudovirales phage TaxID=2100421 RepID=A0A6J5T977_9CAUD|nr:hypothetical protein UFOVP71_3 [uncultured Caudovirales phage]
MRANSYGGTSPHHKLGGEGANKNYGIYAAKIKDNRDPEGLGRLKVWIPQLSNANEADDSSWFTVRYAPLFAGAGDTGKEATANNATKYAQTNQSYGIWMVPPDLNVQVICGFLNGETHQGVWWACLPQDGHTHAIPAVASGSTHEGKVAPVAERNRYNTADPQYEHRPEHPQSDRLKAQGLDKDLQRGHSNAGPFRDASKHPGLAYGILTPGQHQFLMDDGSDGHSGQIRLRTNSGNSIIMDNNCGFIYVVNAAGTAWFQLDAKGNIDMYAGGDFSVNAEGSINLRAGNNVNIDAGANLNAVAATNMNIEACEVFNATGTTGMKLTSGTNMNILGDSQVKLTGQRIDFNGPTADRADLPGTNSLVSNATVGKSVAGRVPEAEPYGGHGCRNEGEQPSAAPGSSGVPESTITPAAESYKDIPPPEQTNAIDCVPDTTQSRLSDEGFKTLISREAYRGVMYSDFQGYSVGYGTRLDIFGPDGAGKIDANLKKALLAGPSEAEARLASRQIIDRENTPRLLRSLEKAKASAGKTVCLTQSQIDALIMASYGNPARADQMASDLVSAAAKSSDGKASNEDVANIWSNSGYNNDSKARNSDAKYAMTGTPNPDSYPKESSTLRDAGVRVDEGRIKNNNVPIPATDDWKGSLGNGAQTGTRVATAYGKPTSQHQGQWERSNYLNTGAVPYGSPLTLSQLSDKYGPPHTGGNVPPGLPDKS